MFIKVKKGLGGSLDVLLKQGSEVVRLGAGEQQV